MKLHDKEWGAIVLANVSNDSDLAPIGISRVLRAFTQPERDWRWPSMQTNPSLLSFRMPEKHFRPELLRVGDGPSIFEDTIAPIRKAKASGEDYYSYPIYFLKLGSIDSEIFVFCYPYAAIGDQIAILASKVGGVRVVTFDMKWIVKELDASDARRKTRRQLALIHGAKTLTDDNAIEIILRGGRLPLDSLTDASLRSVVLYGDDVTNSELYNALRSGKLDGHEYKVSPTAIKIKFSIGNFAAMVLRTDVTGSFTFRPGVAGRNLNKFSNFLNYMITHRRLVKIDPEKFLIPLERNNSI